MSVEESLGAFSCDIGSGRLAETPQHGDIGVDTPMLLVVVPAIVSVIVAIFGQCGSRGCPACVAPWLQQPTIATAGETNRLSNRDKATSLERVITIPTVSSVRMMGPRECDFRHTQT